MLVIVRVRDNNFFLVPNWCVRMWLKSVQATVLHHLVGVDVPSHGHPLRPYVLHFQKSNRRHTALHAQQEFQVADNYMMLPRSHEADEINLRAYLREILPAIPCHEDCQWGLQGNMILRYAAGYLPKFSDSFWRQWLEGNPSPWHLAYKVLTEFHPLEPQMWMTLLRCRLTGHSGRSRLVNVPNLSRDLPWSKEYHSYVLCPLRPGGMDFYRWLHLFRVVSLGESKLYDWAARRLSAASVLGEGFVDAFLLELPLAGEVVVGCRMVPPTNPTGYFAQWCALYIPHRDPEELKKKIPTYATKDMSWFAVALQHAPEFWRDPAAVRKHFEVESNQADFLDNVVAMVAAFVDALDIRQVLGCTLACALESQAHDVGPKALPWSQFSIPQQFHIQEAQAKLRQSEAWTNDESCNNNGLGHKFCIAWSGAAGTGKSAMVRFMLAWCEKHGFIAEVVCPTGRQAARFRTMFPNLLVDTVHGKVRWGCGQVPPPESVMYPDVIFVEEYGMVPEELGYEIFRCWYGVGRKCLLIFVGDKVQLAPVEGAPIFLMPTWKKAVRERSLHEFMRSSQDPTLQSWLHHLRFHRLTLIQLRNLVRGRRFGPPEPRAEDIIKLYKRYPYTTIVTWTVNKAQWVNEVLVRELFDGAAHLGDVMSAPDKDLASHQLIRCRVYAGMRVVLTLNRNKNIGFVNGMGAAIQAREGSGFRVLTDLGEAFTVAPYTDQFRRTYFPWRLGYAVNLSKIQGEDVDHMSLWLDCPRIPAAFYVALSRVRRLDDVVFLGYLSRMHIVPSDYS